MKSTLVIAALVASTLGVSSVVPALAQDAPAPPAPPAVAPAVPTTPPAATTPDPTSKPMHRFARRGGGKSGMNGGRLIALACSDRGAVVLERMLDRTAKRLDLTADQSSLFDTFRTKALTTATSFSQECQAARPDRSKGRPDPIARIQSGLAIDQARITALNAVLPDLQALFDSLSDQQKRELRPALMMGGGMGKNGGQGPHWGKGNGGRPDMPAPSST